MARRNPNPMRVRRDPSRWNGTTKTHPWVDYVPKTPLDRSRSQLHREFDALWRGKRRMFASRPAAYAWLASVLGLTDAECHIARFDAATCRRALETVRSIAP